MAKYINPPFDVEKEVELFRAALNGGKCYSSFNYKVTLPKPTKVNARVVFSPTAYLTIQEIVATCNKEVAWHGTVVKVNKGEYFIDNIMIYPQKVTGVTVESDDDEYPQWIMKLDDDTFNALRFQGHSHVNMGITPSATDKNYYETVLNNLGENDFYIFMIMNKSGKVYMEIHDMADNVIYETSDIEYGYSNMNLDALHNDIKRMVKEPPVYVTPSYGTPSYSWTPKGKETKEQKENKKRQLELEKKSSWYNDYYGGKYYD